MSANLLEEFFKQCGIKDTETKKLTDSLVGLHGIEDVSDLELLSEKELKDAGKLNWTAAVLIYVFACIIYI